MDNRKDRASAIHEAGHAVAMLVHRRRFQHVSIEAQSDSLCRFMFTLIKRDAEPAIGPALDRMAIALAGTAAERFIGRRPRRYSWDEDRKVALWLGYDLAAGDDELTKLYQRVAQRRAELLVEVHWRRIEAVAEALIMRRRLSYDEARAACYPELRTAD